jgi:hypothetical protein
MKLTGFYKSPSFLLAYRQQQRVLYLCHYCHRLLMPSGQRQGEGLMRAVFLDRDGVINDNRADHVKSWAEFQFLPGALTALRLLTNAGFRIFIITNQAAVGRGLMSLEALEDIIPGCELLPITTVPTSRTSAIVPIPPKSVAIAENRNRG